MSTEKHTQAINKRSVDYLARGRYHAAYAPAGDVVAQKKGMQNAQRIAEEQAREITRSLEAEAGEKTLGPVKTSVSFAYVGKGKRKQRQIIVTVTQKATIKRPTAEQTKEAPK